MIFSCEKVSLLSALNTSSRAVSGKSTIPALEGLLFEAGERLKITGYNLETGIITELAADIKEGGAVVISSRLIVDIVRKLPDETLVFSVDEKLLVNISCGKISFNIMGISAADFPELPEADFEQSVSLPQPVLKEMIGGTIFSVSENESRPIHTGCLFDIEAGTLTMVAVDGYRLALRREGINNPEGRELSFVVPGAALKEIERICTEAEEDAAISLGSRHLMFELGDSTLICRLLDGDFLDYKTVVPKKGEAMVIADARVFTQCVERVSLIINDRLKSPIRCHFDGSLVRLYTTTALGNAYDEFEVKAEGLDIEIGFNNKYLLEALKAAPEDEVLIQLSNGISPMLILPVEKEEAEKFLYMVLPVRLKSNEG